MIPCQFNIRAVALPDPHPPLNDLSVDRQILIVQVEVRSPVAPVHNFMIAGENVPMLIELLQKVCDANPALTTERALREGVQLSGEALGRVDRGEVALVEGPGRKQ